MRLQCIAKADDRNADHGRRAAIADRLRLRAQREPADRESLALRHGRFRPFGNVAQEVAVVGHRPLAAIEVTRGGAVGDEHVVGAFAALDVEVLTQFQRAFGADDEESAITPGGQAIRREPIEPHIAADRRCGQDDFGKILEALGLGAERTDAALYDLGVGRIGEGKKLIDRVHADVVDDPAIGRPVEEPRRPQRAIQPMRQQR